jgi:hypothetical protein
VADRDGNDSRLDTLCSLGGRRDGAQEPKCLEVDPGKLDARLLEGVRVAVDRLAVGGDNEDAAIALSRAVDALAQHLVVEYRLIERDPDGFVRAEPHCVRELSIVVDAGDLESADADPVGRNAQTDAAARQHVLGEELV